jgi:hypothetical protein
MDIALYYAPITCALAPYITLTEAGAKFEVRPLNFAGYPDEDQSRRIEGVAATRPGHRHDPSKPL